MGVPWPPYKSTKIWLGMILGEWG